MKAWAVFLVSLISLWLGGCIIEITDPVDVSALVPYQKLEAGTPVVIVLRVGVIDQGISKPSDASIEQKGTLTWITRDTVCVTSVRDGQTVKMLYAGRMVREIRVAGKEPSQLPELTRGAHG